MQIGPRLPSLGGSIGKAIGSVTEPIKHAATSPIGLTIAGLALGGPLGGLASKIPGLGGVAGAAGGGMGGIADASTILGAGAGVDAAAGGIGAGTGLASGVLSRLGLSGKDAIGILGGVAGGVMDQRNNDATRDQSADQFNRTLGFQQQQYGDQHSRQMATSAGLSPVIQRLLGQWGGNGLGDLIGGQPHATPPQMPAQGAPAPMQPPQPPQVMRQPAPVPMRPQPEDQPPHPIMGRLGYARPQMQMMPRAA